jgi:hypothetical protein
MVGGHRHRIRETPDIALMAVKAVNGLERYRPTVAIFVAPLA